jgi:hypothetical protein
MSSNDPAWTGPNKVVEKLSNNSFILQLFNGDRLDGPHTRDRLKRANPKILLDWAVASKITRRRVRNRATEYLVAWQDTSMNELWLPAANVPAQLINAFNRA